jgi:peptide/nickel transport system permease protein
VTTAPDLLPTTQIPWQPRWSAVHLLRRGRPRNLPFQLWLGLVIGGVLVVAAVGSDFVGHFDPNTQNLADQLAPVGSAGHLLGTDSLGRDVLSQALAGLRWSGSVAGLAAVLVAVIGTAVGVLAAMLQGVSRAFLVRVVDVAMSIPGLVIAIVIMAVVGRGFFPLTVTLGIVSWPIFARVVYAEARGLMHREYILASRLLGVSRARSLRTHLLPGLRNTIMIMWAFSFADLLVAEAALSFLGIGAPLGSPSLGNMLSSGQEYLVQDPSLSIVPGIVIVLCVTAANLIGDGVAARTQRAETRVQE